MEMDKWRPMRDRAFAAVEALQAGLARLGVPEALWQRIRSVTGRTGLTYIEVGALTVAEAEWIARALEAVPLQRTVPDAGDDEPDHTRADS
jgi:hypothetical protein